MSCTNWHNQKLLSMYNFSSTDQYFNKPVLNGTFAGYSGSSVIPTAKSVNSSGSTSYNININDLTSSKVTTSSCAKSNWTPILSDCGYGNLFSFGCCGWGMPAEYYTRVGQAYDKTDALKIYNHTSWGTIIKGSLKSNLIDMMSTPSGTVQTVGLAAQGFKGVCGMLGSLWSGIAG